MAIGSSALIGAGALLGGAGSILGGFLGGGSGAGAAQAMNNAAITQANILRDAQNRNRQDLSPYTSAGRSALDLFGQLYGWGTLTSAGGDDPWHWAPNAKYSNEEMANSARAKILGYSQLVPSPTFTELKVSDKFEADPGYQWRISEGNKALDRSASARGGLYSGGQLKALSDWNQNAASNEYGNWWNRYTQGTGFNNALRQQDYGNRYGAVSDVMNRIAGFAGMGQGATNTLVGANSGLAGQTGSGYLNAGISGANAMMAGQNADTNRLISGIGGGLSNLFTGAGYLMGGGGWGGGSSWMPSTAAASAWDQGINRGVSGGFLAPDAYKYRNWA